MMLKDLNLSHKDKHFLFLLSLGLATAFLLLLFGPVFARAQETVEISTPRQTKSLSGRVSDAAGEPIDGVKVERIMGPSNEVEDSVVTDDKGNFELKTVPDGNYIIKFSRPGFKTLILHPTFRTKKKANFGNYSVLHFISQR
jgi:hypothetical protein